MIKFFKIVLLLSDSRLFRQRQQQEGSAGSRKSFEEAAGLSLLQGPQVPGLDEDGPGGRVSTSARLSPRRISDRRVNPTSHEHCIQGVAAA